MADPEDLRRLALALPETSEDAEGRRFCARQAVLLAVGVGRGALDPKGREPSGQVRDRNLEERLGLRQAMKPVLAELDE